MSNEALIPRTPSLGLGGHQSAKMLTDEWLTPPHILAGLGDFDLDPCSPVQRPWDTAKIHWNKNDDGLGKVWRGRVWCNPPYGREAIKWLNKLATHGNGTALVFARTETKMFFAEVWPKAHAILFLRGRLHFHYVSGDPAKSNSGAPSVLIAYSVQDAEILKNTTIPGKFLPLN